jgi:ParB-like chromosome segregation protein Spo0J
MMVADEQGGVDSPNQGNEGQPEQGASSDAPASGGGSNEGGAPQLPAGTERPRKMAAPALIAIDRIDDDRTFQLRPEGDLSLLATDLARLGQLFPVDLRFRPPDRFQVVCGFRRVAALRFLQRDRALARVHMDLSDEDAWLMALASAIHGAPVSPEALTAIRDRLLAEGKLEGPIKDMVEKALAVDESLAPEGVEEEVDADELADDVTLRLGEINQDLSLLADVFSALDESRREELLKQLRYSADLVQYLEGKDR